MRSISFNNYYLSIATAILCTFSLSGFAQEGGAADSSEPSAPALTQGQTATIIARRLGLLTGSSPLTQARAIQLLSSLGVSPEGGWNVDEELSPGALARILVSALGLEDELSADELAGDDDQPFIDLLIEKYDVDVTSLDSVISNKPSSDPLLEDGNDPLPIDQEDLNTVLDALVGSQGGTGGQVGDSSSNITPSAP